MIIFKDDKNLKLYNRVKPFSHLYACAKEYYIFIGRVLPLCDVNFSTCLGCHTMMNNIQENKETKEIFPSLNYSVRSFGCTTKILPLLS